MTDPFSSLVTLLGGRRFAVLTGAGISTESGIPDYRGPETRRRARNPIRFNEYVRSPAGRARYWARSLLGFPKLSAARPNAGHHAIAALERSGCVSGVITQNVDRLHHAAGSRDVVELHGALADVRCLDCGTFEPRSELQERLVRDNPEFRDAAAPLAPDGDSDLPEEYLAGFVPPVCLRCGGTLKPNVVFFGENVARDVVDRGYALVDEAEALLVVGSSLAVFSGLRFVRRASARGIAVAIVNLGETRGDPLAAVRVHERAGIVLPALAEALFPVIGPADSRPREHGERAPIGAAGGEVAKQASGGPRPP